MAEHRKLWISSRISLLTVLEANKYKTKAGDTQGLPRACVLGHRELASHGVVRALTCGEGSKLSPESLTDLVACSFFRQNLAM